MKSWLHSIDRPAFVQLIERRNMPALDRLVPRLPNLGRVPTFQAVLAALAVAFCVSGGRRGGLLIVLLLVAVPLSDQLTSHVRKGV